MSMVSGKTRMLMFSACVVLCAFFTVHPAAWAADASDASANEVTVIDIMMTNYAFTPKKLVLKAGTLYRLHFVNDSSKPHNYVSRDFFAALSMSPEDQAKILKGDQIDLETGESATLDVLPQKTGTYAIRCTHPMHSMLGMKGTAVIE